MFALFLKNIAQARRFKSMKHTFKYLALAAALSIFAGTAATACTVVYKAKQDNPLRLEHGTTKVAGPCSAAAVTPKVAAQLAARGWTLLKVVSVSPN